MATPQKKIAIAAIGLVLAALLVYGVYIWFDAFKQASNQQEIETTALETLESESTETTSNFSGTGTFQTIATDTPDGIGIRAIGNPDAPVKMVEYASLTCSHCASFHLNTLPDLKKRYVAQGDLYIQFEEFPLNAPALDAALLARCMPGERYFSFVDLLFKTQESWSARPDYRVALIQNAKLAGLSEDRANECLESEEMRSGIASRIQEVSQKYEIRSTPTFIVNDGAEVISGAQPLYEFERIFRAVSNNQVAPITTPQE